MYSGGFKVPSETLHRRQLGPKDTQDPGPDLNEDAIERQRRQILRDLDVSTAATREKKMAEM